MGKENGRRDLFPRIHANGKGIPKEGKENLTTDFTDYSDLIGLKFKVQSSRLGPA